MPDETSRWNLKHLVILVAILAVSFALIGVAGTFIGLVVCSPVALARPGRRVDSLYWIVGYYPIFVLMSFYVTWLSGWFALGHPPRSSLDDPKDIDSIGVPYLFTALLAYGILPMLPISLGAMARSPLRPSGAVKRGLWGAAPLFIIPTVWAGCYAILRWDPLRVVEWYFD